MSFIVQHSDLRREGLARALGRPPRRAAGGGVAAADRQKLLAGLHLVVCALRRAPRPAQHLDLVAERAVNPADRPLLAPAQRGERALLGRLLVEAQQDDLSAKLKAAPKPAQPKNRKRVIDLNTVPEDEPVEDRVLSLRIENSEESLPVQMAMF